MKPLVLALVLLWSLFPTGSVAQHGGGVQSGGFTGGTVGGSGFHGGGFTTPGFGGDSGFRGGHFGLPRIRPIPLGWRSRNYGYGGSGLGWGYPNAFNSYGDAVYNDGIYQNPMIGDPEGESCGPVIIQPPPPPARLEVHEYKWPDSSGDTAAAFVLVLKDGSVRPASAVWIQGDTLHYVTPEGAGGRLGLHSVNREGTRLANAAKHLTLWLPAGSQPTQSR